MYKLYRNGYDMQFFDTKEQCLECIQNVVGEYSNLNPRKIYDRDIKTIKGTERLIVYQYYTLYREVFMVIED